jgi:hypothetical protein
MVVVVVVRMGVGVVWVGVCVGGGGGEHPGTTTWSAPHRVHCATHPHHVHVRGKVRSQHRLYVFPGARHRRGPTKGTLRGWAGRQPQHRQLAPGGAGHPPPRPLGVWLPAPQHNARDATQVPTTGRRRVAVGFDPYAPTQSHRAKPRRGAPMPPPRRAPTLFPYPQTLRRTGRCRGGAGGAAAQAGAACRRRGAKPPATTHTANAMPTPTGAHGFTRAALRHCHTHIHMPPVHCHAPPGRRGPRSPPRPLFLWASFGCGFWGRGNL